MKALPLPRNWLDIRPIDYDEVLREEFADHMAQILMAESVLPMFLREVLIGPAGAKIFSGTLYEVCDGVSDNVDTVGHAGRAGGYT